MLVICFVCFLSFVSAAQDFSRYQSDGMLLEAGLIANFFAPPGFGPGLGHLHPASRARLFLLPWQVGVILTANDTFLNYLVLAMGVLLLDDRFVLGVMPEKCRVQLMAGISRPERPPTLELRTWKDSSGRYWRLLSFSASTVMLT